MLRAKVLEKEVKTVRGKEKERTIVVLIEGKAQKYSIKIVEFSKNSKWQNRSIGCSLGSKEFDEAEGKEVFIKFYCSNCGNSFYIVEHRRIRFRNFSYIVKNMVEFAVHIAELVVC